MLEAKIQQEIVDSLSRPKKPFQVILFGSHAYGIPHEDSDIDLIVILDKEGISDSYRTLMKNRQEISARLRSLKKKYPIDLIVYTKEEWYELRACGSSFIREIEEKGVFLIRKKEQRNGWSLPKETLKPQKLSLITAILQILCFFTRSSVLKSASRHFWKNTV